MQKLGADEIDLMVLKQAGVVSALAIDAPVIASGEISRKVSVRGIGVTKGAKAAIEAAGGSVAVAAAEKPAGRKQARLAERRKGPRRGDRRGRPGPGRGEGGGQAGTEEG